MYAPNICIYQLMFKALDKGRTSGCAQQNHQTSLASPCSEGRSGGPAWNLSTSQTQQPDNCDIAPPAAVCSFLSECAKQHTCEHMEFTSPALRPSHEQVTEDNVICVMPEVVSHIIETSPKSITLQYVFDISASFEKS
ncbi:hypothetical protein DPX16_12250 [Anabarilius grahami]|uniref:Uncharacterized protein n=1 Tax=Anabarilius grahami TaxID=495550 RepID=A0A3N0XFG8_ANAGA|nr:hypothetical protein DPX16_12250 [Anabarilius grahami]